MLQSALKYYMLSDFLISWLFKFLSLFYWVFPNMTPCRKKKSEFWETRKTCCPLLDNIWIRCTLRMQGMSSVSKLQKQLCFSRTACGQLFTAHPLSTFSSPLLMFSLLSHIWLFATPWTAACLASLSFTISQSLLKLMFIELVMPSTHLILCFPLLLLPSVFSSIRVFSSESALPFRWPKCWSFSISQSVSQFSCSVVSNSLRPHGLQHARLPCLSPTPGA